MNVDDEAATITSIFRAQIVRYMTAVSITILAFDWLLLLGEEIELIWSSKWSLVKLFYFATRYPTFIDVSLTVAYYFTPGLASSKCLIEYQAGVSLAAVGTACTELVLIWRTYALYGKSRKILIGLVIMWSCWVLGNVYPVIRFTQSVQFVSQTLPGVPGCYLLNGDEIIFTCYATLLAVEIVIVILTLVKGIRSHRHTRSPLVTTLYRDGVLFFLLVTGFSLGNVLALLAAPIEFVDLLNTLARVMHTVLCCRVIIHLRRAARIDTFPTTQPRRTFKSRLFFKKHSVSDSTDTTTNTNDTRVASDQTETYEMTDMTSSTNVPNTQPTNTLV